MKNEWYGPEEERHLAPVGFSHLLFGIDLGEMAQPMLELSQALFDGCHFFEPQLVLNHLHYLPCKGHIFPRKANR